MDRAWGTYKYYANLSVSIFKVKVSQGHEVKERSNSIFYVWDACYVFLGQFSVKNTKNDPKHFLNGPTRTKFENCENAEIPGNSVRNGHF